jgi:hypothetical protein
VHFKNAMKHWMQTTEWRACAAQHWMPACLQPVEAHAAMQARMQTEAQLAETPESNKAV